MLLAFYVVCRLFTMNLLEIGHCGETNGYYNSCGSGRFLLSKFSSNENKSNKENKNRHLKDHSDYDFIQYIMQVSFSNLA